MSPMLSVMVSISEPRHTIWQLEMASWSMHETSTSRNGDGSHTCHPVLRVDNGSTVHNQTNTNRNGHDHLTC